MSHDSRLPAAALSLAKRGFAIFPLKARDKIPVTKHGFKDASTDPKQVTAWWEGWPEQNIGIATGEASGIWVLDVDGEDGEASLKRLTDTHGALPCTVEVITGRGRHLYFRWVDGVACTAKRLGDGLDTRGNNGYVVAPPSIHPSGRAYAWSVDCADEFADAPDWLVKLVRGEPRKLNGTTNGHDHGADKDRLLARLPKQLVHLIDTTVVTGQRSEHSFKVMCLLFENGLSDLEVRLVADGAAFAEKFWQRGDLIEEINRARGRWERNGSKRAKSSSTISWRAMAMTAAELQRREFPLVSWVVPGLIPEGVTLFAGKPKIGKSWWALDLALGVGSDRHVMGGIKPEHGDVLYAALEDNPRRLQKRVRKLLMPGSTSWPERLTLATAWRRLDQGGIEDIADWCDGAAQPKLVILDTLAGVRPIRTSSGYTEDYDALAALHRLANDRGIAVVVLHHTRKMDAEDPVDQVSGTLGLAGCADTVIVLNRTSNGTTLYGRGRDRSSSAPLSSTKGPASGASLATPKMSAARIPARQSSPP